MNASRVTFTRPSSDEQGSGVNEEDRASHGRPEAADLELAHTLVLAQDVGR